MYMEMSPQTPLCKCHMLITSRTIQFLRLYTGGDWEDYGSRPARAKRSQRLSPWENTNRRIASRPAQTYRETLSQK
jgi:hypothetical protein